MRVSIVLITCCLSSAVIKLPQGNSQTVGNWFWSRSGFKGYQDVAQPPTNYSAACHALIELRRTGASRAQWCLERLVPLYEQQVKEHPTVLEHRLSLADTLNELALLRIDTLDTALRRSELDAVEAVRQTQQAVTEAKRAVDVLGGIITQAKQDIDRLRTTRPDVVERNEKLIRDLTPLLTIFKADQRAVETARQRYLRLRVARGQFDRQPDAKHAQSLAHLLGRKRCQEPFLPPNKWKGRWGATVKPGAGNGVRNRLCSNNDWEGQLVSGRPTLDGEQVTTEYSHDVTEMAVTTYPDGAFNGKASCHVKPRRDVEWRLLARAAQGGDGIVLYALDKLPLSWNGIDFGQLIADRVGKDSGTGEAKAGATASLAFGIPDETEVVVAGNLATVNTLTVYHSPANDDPTGDIATANSNLLLPDEEIKISPQGTAQFAQYANAIVFKVGDPESQTRLPFWTKSTSQARKKNYACTASAWVVVKEIELTTPADPDGAGLHTNASPFHIWTIDNGE